MTELEQVLTEIKNEKDTKITPSALRYGTKVFGITGTYEAGIEPVGGENVTCVALEEIKTGDVCALLSTNGNTYEGSNTRPLPASAKDGSNTKALTYHREHEGGKYVTAYSGAYMFLFKWDGAAYQQMKVGGSYVHLQEGYNGQTNAKNLNLSIWIDNGRIYYQYINTLVISRIDDANNNVIYEYKNTSLGQGNMMVCVHDSNLFVTKAIYSSPYSSGRCSTYQYYYNTSTKSITSVGYVTSGMYSEPKYNMYSTHEAFDFAFNDATGEMFIYCVGYNKAYSSTTASYMPRLRKFKKDSSGIYRVAATMTLPALRSNDYSSGAYEGLSTCPIDNPKCQIGNYGQYFLALVSGGLTLGLLDTDKMTYKSVDIQFIEPDGTPLNKANISKFILFKEDNIVAVYTSESRFTSTERVRLYKLSVSEDNYWGFNFICVPYNTFSPAVPSGTMPYEYPCADPNTKDMLWNTANGVLYYELKSLPDGATYKAYPCGNQLATNLSVNGYGIAYCDIAKGDASIVSKLIEGATIIPDDYINSQIGVLIGGKY